MLEKLPKAVGHALEDVRAGITKILYQEEASQAAPEIISLRSPAFVDGGIIPVRYTADGSGLSPPLSWRGAPGRAASLVIVVEDADSPTLNPLVHAIVHDLPAVDGGLEEGALPSGQGGEADPAMGRNSFFKTGWLAPDPPPGHGAHRYVFQIFALDYRLDLDKPPGRGVLAQLMRGHVVGRGKLTGLYARG
ncbi:MAG: YbhB/YbcL family Raf kinase inhibitor-like protein [Caulobacter sp.]|nr:YbhB/YbcL family Raf kinase inhibitor-like protein [Caulobacter sp.]